MKHRSINLKWSIIWILINFVSLFLLGWGIQQLGLKNSLVILFITGFGITIISRAIQTLRFKRSFVVDEWFFFCSIINTFTIWSMLLLTKFLNISNNLISLFLTAVMLVIVAYFLKRTIIGRVNIVITSIIVILVLYFFNSGLSLDYANNQNVDVNNLLSNIKNSVSNLILPLSTEITCPQINVPITKLDIAPMLHITEYDGWIVAPYDSNSQFFGFNFGWIYCNKGNQEGQRPDYLYCGDGRTGQTNLGYIQKTLVNKDGTLGKTIKRTFYNVYDENEQFVKTVCGGDPDNG